MRQYALKHISAFSVEKAQEEYLDKSETLPENIPVAESLLVIRYTKRVWLGAKSSGNIGTARQMKTVGQDNKGTVSPVSRHI